MCGHVVTKSPADSSAVLIQVLLTLCGDLVRGSEQRVPASVTRRRLGENALVSNIRKVDLQSCNAGRSLCCSLAYSTALS